MIYNDEEPIKEPLPSQKFLKQNNRFIKNYS